MLLRSELVLTYDGARVALDAALRRAERVGGSFNIAVTDRAGALLAFARMDGSFAASGGIAQDKAWTVTAFGGLPTDGLYDAISAEDAVREGIGQRGRVAAFGGGVPITVGGSWIGAVGVSGGSAAQDEDVALAGAAAVVAAITGTPTVPGSHRTVIERTHHDAVHAASR
ncbi:heme-binding protein [Oryzobacter terrae]|uniref:GlcG/HbpS family heme-binding protein n=1 Tax=Oryzobacter terrae TaxID=1620385 RepID=UPI00366B8882